MIEPNSIVIHKQYGQCSVIAVVNDMAIIKTDHGLEQCPMADLTLMKDVWEDHNTFSSLKALLHLQGNLITSINNSWGVFSQTNIQLLPHQLWVCNRTMRHWPTRMLIADDVGLGKTIEAGLILMSARSSGKAKRILILTPASLTGQWEKRMSEMFGMNFVIYSTKTDKETEIEFKHDLLIASLPTIRQLEKERMEKFLSTEPWDMVLVDEAHHAGMSPDGKTLGFSLIETMEECGLIRSLLFFTATPHQGKNELFWPLMELLGGSVFSAPSAKAYEALPEFMIRNSKSTVTDMNGQKLFKGIHQHPHVYSYTEEESEFYQTMSSYIQSGEMYCKHLSEKEAKQVGLVLNALQKIASSSVAAIRNALRRRLNTLAEKAALKKKQLGLEKLEEDCLENPEEVFDYYSFKLMEHEEERIRELLAEADKVKHESKIVEIGKLVREEYPDDSILFFTEYKATQAMMVSALRKKYGKDSVGFINGDDFLVIDGDKEKSNRKEVMKAFNAGTMKYLVSTEASGEGVDLQKSCHVLIHIDLPWNPMRLHQRVGRIYRYGQTKDVDVVTMRSADNLESNIWEKLDTKLTEINKAFSHVMDTPEDMKMLVLGIETPGFYESLFAEAHKQTAETLDRWFDQKTKRFGDKSVLEAINAIEGNASRFDLRFLDDVPKLDLEDLRSFADATFRAMGKSVRTDENGVMTFNMPEEWKIKNTHKFDPTEFLDKHFIFDRSSDNVKELCAVNNIFFDKALATARNYEENFARIKGEYSYLVIKVYEQDTTKKGLSDYTFVGYRISKDGSIELVRQFELFKIVEELLASRYPKEDTCEDRSLVIGKAKAEELRQRALNDYKALGIEYDYPESEIFALLAAI